MQPTTPTSRDHDIHKGAFEDGRPNASTNAPGLDNDGLPNHNPAIAHRPLPPPEGATPQTTGRGSAGALSAGPGGTPPRGAPEGPSPRLPGWSPFSFWPLTTTPPAAGSLPRARKRAGGPPPAGPGPASSRFLVI